MGTPSEKPVLGVTFADLYTLVQGVDGKVTALDGKFDTHLQEHAEARGVQVGRASVFSMVRTFITTIAPLPAMILAVLALLTAVAAR